MSCIITYNGQNFTQEDFLDYLKSQIPASNIIKPGVEEVFEVNPELAEIGTQEQYSQYLDTIFPDSKVKDIVYHGSESKIKKFNKGFIHFYKNIKNNNNLIFHNLKHINNLLKKHIEYAKNTDAKITDDIIKANTGLNPDLVKYLLKDDGFWTSSYALNSKNYYNDLIDLDIINGYNETENTNIKQSDIIALINIIYAVVNIKKLKHWEDFNKNEGIHNYLLNKVNIPSDIDGIIGQEAWGANFSKSNQEQIVVFEPEQVHILGSKQDIDGFKRFAQNSGTITSKENPMQIYVDGSDIKGTGAIGYGAYAEYNNKTYELSGTNESDSVKELQKKFPQATFSNPTMEMLGLLETLKKFATTSEHIVINQDYKGAISYGELWNYSEGSEQRPDKPWNAKEAYIKDIVDQSVDIIKQIESNGGSVKINWVKGHQTGTSIHKKGNDNADRVAKDRNIKDTFDEFNNTDFESRDNFSNFAEEAFECK